MALNIKTKEELIKVLREHKVELVNLWFVDILGMIKSIGIMPGEIEEALDEGFGFDGSSVEGFARIYESDLIALPDIETFQLLPWKINGGVQARMICDIVNPDRTPYEGDPRYVLKRILKKAEKMGFKLNLGPELEYFYFDNDREPQLIDRAGYFDLLADELGTELRQRTINALVDMGVRVEAAHHEVAPGQHEIDLRFADALWMADATLTYRYIVKMIARQRNVYATFMPKPLFGVNGSGMHVHMSIVQDGKNIFFDETDSHHLSKTGRSFMAGLMKHAKEICSITNQWVNSYKRLVPGYEAPAYVAWGNRNRSALVRVPTYKPGKEEATRVEFRCPDPACNPYLAFSVMIAAGLKGIEKGYIPFPPVEEDIFHMSDAEKQKFNIDVLPDSLHSAVSLTEKSELVREALGEHVFTKFIENKKIEWDNYRIRVTDYEINQYLPRL